MKIAIPVYLGRVSPVFDWSTCLLVIETGASGEIRREDKTIAGASPMVRAERLADLEVQTLLCGGISSDLLSVLETRGIRVIPWIAGEVEDVLDAFLAGRIPGEEFLMPGCCGGRRRQRHRKRVRGGGRGRRGGGPRRPL